MGNTTKKQDSIEIDKYHSFEIAEILNRTQGLLTLRIQIFVFFGTANVTILGFAFSTKLASLFFVAASTMLILIMIDIFMTRTEKVLYYRGIQLEQKYAPDSEDTLLNIYSRVILHEKKLPEVFEIKDKQRQIEALKQFHPSKIGFWFPLIVSLLQIFSGIGLWLIFSWHFI